VTASDEDANWSLDGMSTFEQLFGAREFVFNEESTSAASIEFEHLREMSKSLKEICTGLDEMIRTLGRLLGDEAFE